MPEATSLPPSVRESPFLPFPLVDSPGSHRRAHSPAAKHFDAIYAVKQPYIKSTLSTFMFRVGLQPGTEISVHAEFSNCGQKL